MCCGTKGASSKKCGTLALSCYFSYRGGLGFQITGTQRGKMSRYKLPMKRLATTSLILLLGFETACSLGQTAAVTPCHGDRVQTSPGVIFALSSGQTYQVFPTDNRISMTWLPLDKLIVCPIGGSGVEITNTTEKGEKVRAIQIFNLSWYLWPL